MKTLLLIDANSLIHRCYHALPPLTSPEGKPSQALYGISNILLKLIKEDGLGYAAAAFDRPEPTFRKEHYSDYKAHRPPTPGELIYQIQEAHTLFSKFGIRTVEKVGFEADDCIATLAEKFRDNPDVRIVILTGDLDTLQLVEGDKVVVRTFRKGISDTFTYNENAVKDRYGLSPSQLADYKALVGDVSDNVKGVPGIGPKTASSLLQRFSNLEGVMRALPSDPKMAAKLEPHKGQLTLSKFLVTLKRDADIGVETLDDLRIPGEVPSEILSYFQSMGFETLVRRLSGEYAKPRPPKNIRSFSGQSAIFQQPSSQPPVLEKIADAILVAGDEDPEALSSEKIKAGFGLKEILKSLWAKGKDMAPPYADLSVAFWLIDPDLKAYAPETLSEVFLKKKWEGTREDLENLFSFAISKLRQYELDGVFNDIEMPLLRILAEMEFGGVKVSKGKLEKIEKDLDKELNSLTAAIYKAAGEEFNINSPRQLSKIIFEKLGLRVRGAISTSADKLEALREAHPIIPLILKYRENFKIQSTYIKPLQELVSVNDGRIHTRFIQTGTGTGRLSSQSPNLQNIPQESAWSQPLRSSFEAEDGRSFVAFDYSQIELRIVAALSGDENMASAFRRGDDIHRLTASKVFSIPESKVTPKERRIAKSLNFGLIYGMGVSAFSKQVGIPRKEAQEFIDTYFKTFFRVGEWREKVKDEIRATGYAQTLTGRRRYFFGIASQEQRFAAEAERAGVNHPIQGLEADIIKLAMIGAKRELEKKRRWNKEVSLLLSIHDELLFEVRDDIISEMVPVVRQAMESAFDLSVPLKVDVSCGKDWGHMQKIRE